MSLCIFCFRYPDDPRPWCPDNPGFGCTYGFHHERVTVEVPKPKQPKTSSKFLCTKCGLHPKNPLSASNGCQHTYGE
jgi:hypothetical protein